MIEIKNRPTVAGICGTRGVCYEIRIEMLTMVILIGSKYIYNCTIYKF
jgi:hypothetical protein